jgi:hypothetical protein
MTIRILDIIHWPVLYLKHRMDNAVPHSKHVTSQLRAQQVNAIHRFVMMLC